MRGLVLAATILIAPITAHAAEASSESLVLAKRLMSTLGDTDAARAAVLQMARTMAHGFAAGAAETGTPLNPKALDRAVKIQIKAFTPQFVNAGAKAYASTYTADELRQFIAYYRKSEAKRGKLPAALQGKDNALGEARAAKTAPLWAKMQTDLFANYCSRTTCTDGTRKVIVAYGHI